MDAIKGFLNNIDIKMVNDMLQKNEENTVKNIIKMLIDGKIFIQAISIVMIIRDGNAINVYMTIQAR
jgi:nitrogen regulatory protein PII